MIARPCSINVPCGPCTGDGTSPFENLSSEAPDPVDFISMAFYGWTPPINGGVGSFQNGGGTGGQNNWNRNHTIGTGGSSVNQQLADQAAERDAHNNAWNPPGRTPAQTVYGNEAQTVTLECPDGTSFSYTVPAGTYTALDQVTANQRALQMAQKNAPANQVCISTTSLVGACLGDDYSDTLMATGGTLFEWGGYFWQVTSGALPDGLTLNEQTGEISGTPTGTGSFAFTITVADYFFNTTSKDYTITVSEITTDTLPSAIVSTAYSQTISASPSGGVFALTGGNLPASLIVASDGTVSGTPDPGDNGIYNLTVSYTILGVTCSKSINLRIWDSDNTSMGTFAPVDTGANNLFGTLTPGVYTIGPFGANGGRSFIEGGFASYVRVTGSLTRPIVVTEFGDISNCGHGLNDAAAVAAHAAYWIAHPIISTVEITVNTDIYWSWQPEVSPVCGLTLGLDAGGIARSMEIRRIGKP